MNCLHGIEGCGEVLGRAGRTWFFKILKQVLDRLRDATTSVKHVFFYLNMLRWKYSAQDLHYLHRLDVFGALAGEPGSPVYAAWLHTNLVFENEMSAVPVLNKEMLNTFEYLFFGVVSRTLQVFEKQKTKVKGTSLELERKTSVVNESVSLDLLTSAMRVLV